MPWMNVLTRWKWCYWSRLWWCIEHSSQILHFEPSRGIGGEMFSFICSCHTVTETFLFMMSPKRMYKVIWKSFSGHHYLLSPKAFGTVSTVHRKKSSRLCTIGRVGYSSVLTLLYDIFGHLVENTDSASQLWCASGPHHRFRRAQSHFNHGWDISKSGRWRYTGKTWRTHHSRLSPNILVHERLRFSASHSGT